MVLGWGVYVGCFCGVVCMISGMCICVGLVVCVMVWVISLWCGDLV